MHDFSKIELSRSLPPERLARAVPANAYAEHQMLWRLFEDSREWDFLFRREQTGPWPVFYLLSASPPRDEAGDWIVQTTPTSPP
jgi:CRISPR system Cascade subunit CasE